MKKFFNRLGKFIIWFMAMVAFNDTIQARNVPDEFAAVLYMIGLAAWFMLYITED